MSINYETGGGAITGVKALVPGGETSIKNIIFDSSVVDTNVKDLVGAFSTLISKLETELTATKENMETLARQMKTIDDEVHSKSVVSKNYINTK